MEVSELRRGNLFTLEVDRHQTVFEFLEFGENTCRVMPLLRYWPKGARGKGQPAAWLRVSDGEQNCNSYAPCTIFQNSLAHLKGVV